MVGTANRMLGMIYRTFAYKSVGYHIAFVQESCSHLEFCVLAWCHHLKKDIDIIEKVQRRATSMIVE